MGDEAKEVEVINLEDFDEDWDELPIGTAVDSIEPVALAKAHFIGRDVEPSNVKEPEERHRDRQLFSSSGSLAPPYDPAVMCKLWEHSNSLRQNIDAYSVNIDGNGHRFEPVIDLDADDAFDQVRDAIFFERLTELDEDEIPDEDLEGEDDAPPEVEYPTDAEVEERIKSMTDAMRLEKAKIDAFFRFCCIDESFISLRMKTRQDQEVMGNGYWEILRNTAGEPAQFTYIPGFTVRLMPIEKVPISITQKIKRAPLTFEDITVQKRFRRYVQVFEGRKIYYKEFGDPRTVSAATGRTYKDMNEFKREEETEDGSDPIAATEILHFSIHSPRSPYGIPRWIGVLLSVLGSRQAEEVNFLYFENKSIPPMAILVSGGRLTKDSTKKLESFIENRIKGRSNFHKILIIEGMPADRNQALEAGNATASMKIEIVPLTGAQQSDALFQKYDERNIDKVGMSFRLPRLLRGDIRDFNRATAESALEFAETQVFSPEREAFDWLINRKLLSELGIKFWTFASNAPTTRNPIDLAEIVERLVKVSVLTPQEGRELAEAIFNRNFKKIDELWTQIPPELLKAGILPDAGIGEFEEGEVDEEGEEDPEGIEAAEGGDVSTGDLNTQGGAKVPAQGNPKDRKRRKGFVKLPASIGKRYATAARHVNMRKLARDLMRFREILKAEENRALEEEQALAEAIEHERDVVHLTKEQFEELIGDAAE